MIFTNIIPLFVMAEPDYTVSPDKKTIYLDVPTYDKEIWDSIFNNTFNPNKWFSGNFSGDNINSKYTVRGWFDSVQWNTSEAMSNLLVPQENFSVWIGLSQIGYNKTFINERYDNYTYELTVISRSRWNYTSSNLPVNASYPNDFILIFENPNDYNRLFDDYNDLIDNINSNFTAKFLRLDNLTKYSADDYFWRMIIENQMGVMNPQDEYLNEIITSLRLNTTQFEDEILKIERSGILENYTVEISFGENGIISHFVSKNNEDQIFLEIESSSTQDQTYTVLISIGIIVALVIIIALHQRKKRMDQYKEKLEKYE
jgi:hypothetical protein